MVNGVNCGVEPRVQTVNNHRHLEAFARPGFALVRGQRHPFDARRFAAIPEREAVGVEAVKLCREMARLFRQGLFVNVVIQASGDDDALAVVHVEADDVILVVLLVDRFVRFVEGVQLLHAFGGRLSLGQVGGELVRDEARRVRGEARYGAALKLEDANLVFGFTQHLCRACLKQSAPVA